MLSFDGVVSILGNFSVPDSLFPQAPAFHQHLHSCYALTGIKCIHLSVPSSVASTVWLIKKLIDTNCCQLCQKTLTNLVSFLTFCSSWSLQWISAGTTWKHQGPLGSKYSWQLSGQTIAASLKTDSGGSVGKRYIFCNVDFFCNFVIQLLSIISPSNFDHF